MKIWHGIALCFALCLGSAAMAHESVSVEQITVVVPRPNQAASGESKAILRYPRLKSVANVALRKRLQAAVMPQRTYHGSLAEMRRDGWLMEVTYKIHCNQRGIFDVSYEFYGVGAYPDSFNEYITLDIRTGKRLKASDVFASAALPALAAKINQAMQADIRQAIQNVDKENQADIKQRLSGLTFTLKDMSEFTVSPKGVTFYYSFGFPHVIKAAEPEGRYFFSFADLKPFVRRDGLLNTFLR